jgi:hypothetical protein
VAQALGDKLHAQEERDQQRGEKPFVRTAVQQQGGGHRRPGAQDLHDHEAAAAEIAPEDADHIGDRHRKAGKLCETVGGRREREVTPDSQQRDRGRGASDVTALPPSGLFAVADALAHARIGAHVETAHGGDHRDGQRAGEQQNLPGLPKCDEDRADDENRSHQQGAAVLVEGIDQRNVDFRRQRFRTLDRRHGRGGGTHHGHLCRWQERNPSSCPDAHTVP